MQEGADGRPAAFDWRGRERAEPRLDELDSGGEAGAGRRQDEIDCPAAPSLDVLKEARREERQHRTGAVPPQPVARVATVARCALAVPGLGRTPVRRNASSAAGSSRGHEPRRTRNAGDGRELIAVARRKAG